MKKRDITRRQREVLKLIAEGLTSRQIAGRLGLSFKTIEAHRSDLMTRLGIHNIAGLVRYALDNDFQLETQQKILPAGVGVSASIAAGPKTQDFTDPVYAELTDRERDVMRLVADGFSTREIAQRYGVTAKTVENHRNRVMRKLRVKNTALLVRRAVRCGLVAP